MTALFYIWTVSIHPISLKCVYTTPHLPSSKPPHSLHPNFQKYITIQFILGEKISVGNGLGNSKSNLPSSPFVLVASDATQDVEDSYSIFRKSTIQRSFCNLQLGCWMGKRPHKSWQRGNCFLHGGHTQKERTGGQILSWNLGLQNQTIAELSPSWNIPLTMTNIFNSCRFRTCDKWAEIWRWAGMKYTVRPTIIFSQIKKECFCTLPCSLMQKQMS